MAHLSSIKVERNRKSFEKEEKFVKFFYAQVSGAKSQRCICYSNTQLNHRNYVSQT